MRKIRISTISLYLPEGETKLKENVNRAVKAIEQALEYKPDIICLPECYPILWSSKEDINKSVETSSDINNKMKELARKGVCYIISNILEKSNGNIYNTAFLIDRKGEITGKYSKTHLSPRERIFKFESDLYGNSPGDKFPIFETDFGKIAIMICMDIHVVEVARIYGVKGAEILFWPTQAYGPSEDFLITLIRSRAMDNQMYCVASNFCKKPYHPGKEMGRACIVGLDGKIIVDTGNSPGLATADIDLDEQIKLDWSYTGKFCKTLTKNIPNLKKMIYKTRRPKLYGALAKEANHG